MYNDTALVAPIAPASAAVAAHNLTRRYGDGDSRRRGRQRRVARDPDR